jgi:DNA-binding MarR family transcriptional regulator
MKLEEELRNSKPIPPKQRAFLNILFTASWIDCEINRQLRPFGLTNPQYNILRILNGSAPDGLSMLDIRSRMIDRSSNVSRLVEKLRERGWVERVPNQADRRGVIVTISTAGKVLLDQITQQIFSPQNHIPNDSLTLDEYATLADLLDRFRG